MTSNNSRPSLAAVSAVLALTLLACVAVPARAEPPAKELFGRVVAPAPLSARAIGSYARGCLSGAVPLPVDGPAWQVMRLSRNRNWGHPNLIAMIERLAMGARSEGWNGLLVGDLAQPRGGPMLSGHTSHQIGLDADIWLTPMPNRRLSAIEREQMSAVSMLKGDTLHVDPAIWTSAHAALIRRAAKHSEVERIFVHPGIKEALCQGAGSDRAWLRKIRPWWGHYYHFHVRLECPPGSAGCSNQSPPPPGDGCGKELAWWFTPEPWKPSPPSKAEPLMLSDLPKECRAVLEAGAATTPAAAVPLPPLRR